MRLQVRALRLRVDTAEGTFGSDFHFKAGLNVVRADNTKGKTTCMQAILYSLGLERMLSAKRDIPLPYVMTTELKVQEGDVERRLPVVSSHVQVELGNGRGDVITVLRAVKGERDNRLVTVWKGGVLTDPGTDYPRQDYFALDAGSASRASGYHTMLAEFIGWELPRVAKFDRGDTPLYLETLFPLLFVEQKVGWSSLTANFPTFFGIREVGKRAIEFIASLDVQGIASKRQELEGELADLRSRWASVRKQAENAARRVNGRLEGVPAVADGEWPGTGRPFVSVVEGSEWTPLDHAASRLRGRRDALLSRPVHEVGVDADALTQELESLERRLDDLTATQTAMHSKMQLERAQFVSMSARLQAIDEDLVRNKDALKLRELGSTLGSIVSQARCPTCHQHVDDMLMADSTGEPMTLESNIAFLTAQRKLCQMILERSQAALRSEEPFYSAATGEARSIRARIRAIRVALVQPSTAPSVADVQERVAIDGALSGLVKAEEEIGGLFGDLEAIAKGVRSVNQRLASHSHQGLSRQDNRKLDRYTNIFVTQLVAYQFSTFNPADLEISKDTYKPTKEGYEIGFELSASDAIRVKWAYLQGLLELAREFPDMRHPGLLVFDEPRQQETARTSFAHLVARAATAKKWDQQVIFATSEDLDELLSVVGGVDIHLQTVDGWLIKRLEEAGK